MSSIKLEDSVELSRQRIAFLSQFPESEFRTQLERVSRPLAKNEKLAEMCLQKLKTEKDLNRQIGLLNQAMTMTDNAEACGSISEQMSNLLGSRLPSLDAKIEDQNSKEASSPISLEAVRGAVSLRENPNCGRFVVADEGIPPGTVVAADRPTLKMPNQKHVKTHCWHCLRHAHIGLHPCKGCSGVVFCSAECEAESQKSYHSNIGIWNLAFRAFVASNKSTPNPAYRLENLVTHYGYASFNAPELMKEALVALFLSRMATGHVRGELTCAALDSAVEIHRLMRALKFNCHEVLSGYREEAAAGETTASPQRIGYAVNPVLAMINHSCNPNTGRVWINGGEDVIVIATRPIRKGEEILDVYSGVFSKSPPEDRQVVHARYNFECACVACREDWPMAVDGAIERRITGLKPTAYKNREAAGGKKLKQLVKLADKIQRLRNDNVEEALRLHESALSLGHELLQSPHNLLLTLEDTYHRWLWKHYTNGNNKYSVKQSLELMTE